MGQIALKKGRRIPTKGTAPRGLYGYKMDKPLQAMTIRLQLEGLNQQPSRQVRRQLERLNG